VKRYQGDLDLAAVGRLLGEGARARILAALGDGRGLPATVLAREAGVAPSTASAHLARLVEGGLLRVETHGRHRYFRLSRPEVAEVLEKMAMLAPPTEVRSLRGAIRGEALREARTCYDHLAGKLGVAVLRSLVRLRALEGHDGSLVVGADRLSAPGSVVDYRLGPEAPAVLDDLGIALGAVTRRRPLIRYCVDWSEQQHHLSGALGAAIADRLLALHWLTRTDVPRVVKVTDAGRRGLARVLGLPWPAPRET
jgi:DNA-binding transcriptional ArsR family regulator